MILADIKIGCIETPERGSYFCKKHNSFNKFRKFKYRETTLMINIEEIKPRLGRMKNKGLVIHDIFINQDDINLFLVDYEDSHQNSWFWATEKQIQSVNVKAYLEQISKFKDEYDTIFRNCKATYAPCYKKSRTVGIFLACYNCGIIANYKEIFQHESIAQAASFIMDTITYSEKWPNILIYDDGCILKNMLQTRVLFCLCNHHQEPKFFHPPQ